MFKILRAIHNFNQVYRLSGRLKRIPQQNINLKTKTDTRTNG